MAGLLDLPTGNATESVPDQQQSAPDGDALADQVASQAQAEGPLSSASTVPAATPPADEQPKSAKDYLQLLDKQNPDNAEPKSANDYLDLLNKQSAPDNIPLPLAAHIVTAATNVVGAFGYNFTQDAGRITYGIDPQTRDEMSKVGAVNSFEDMDKEQAQSIGQMFIHPFATAMYGVRNLQEAYVINPLEYAVREVQVLPNALLSGTAGALSELSEEMGEAGPNILVGGYKIGALPAGMASELVRAVQGGFGLGGEFGFPHGSESLRKPELGPPPMPLDIARGAEVGATAPDEVYFGTREPTPEEQAQQRIGSQITNLYDTQAGLPKETATPMPDIEGTARRTEPALFNEYDQLNARKEFYTKSLEDLMAKSREEAAQSAPHNEEIASLKEKMADANARKSKIYQGQIEELEKKNAEYIEDQMNPINHSTDIRTVRAELSKISERLGHVNQDVEAARRSAMEEQSRPETINASETPSTQTLAKESPLTVEKYVDDYLAGKGRNDTNYEQFAANNATDIEHEFKRRYNEETSSSSSETTTLERPEESTDATIEKFTDDYSSKLVKAGTTKEYADAVAKLHGEALVNIWQKYYPKGTLGEVVSRFGSQVVRDNKANVGEGTLGKTRIASKNKGTQALITLFKNANASTMIHELGHHFLDVMTTLAKDKDAPEALLRDLDTVHHWLKVEDGKELTRAQHEKFAKSFEKYVHEGVAPSNRLLDVFAKMKDWMAKAYETMKKTPIKINDDIRKVFDNLLTRKGEEKPGMVIPETKIGEHLANIHERDAVETMPKHAAAQWDTIQQEKDYLTKLYDPEVFDELNAKDGDKSAATAENSATGTATESTAGEAGTAEQPGAVNEGPDNAGGQSDAVRAGAETHGSPTTGGESASPNPASESSAANGATPSAGSTAQTGEQPTGPWNAEGQVGKSGRFLDKEGKPEPGALNWALYHDTPDWLQRYYDEYAERNRGTFNDPTGGVETLESMQTLMKATAWTPDEIRNMEIGQKRNRLQQLASAELFNTLKKAAVEAATKAADSKDPKLITEAFEKLQDHKLLIQLFKDQQAYSAEASRGLGVRRAIKGIVGEDSGRFTELFQRITDIDPKDINRQAKFLKSLADVPGAAEKFLKDGAQTKWQKFRSAMLEYYINALISGPITHLRYATGNAINALATPLIEIPTAATIGYARELFTGEKGIDRVYYGESIAQLYALGKGSREGLRSANTAWKTGNSPALPGEGVSDMFLAKQSQGHAISGVAGDVINIPSHAVAAIHSFSKSIRYEQEIHGQAYRNAIREGLTGEDMYRRVADLATNPTEEMMKSATEKALRELFMTPTNYNSLGGQMTRFTNSNMAAKIVVPFMKIGSQITRNAFMDRTPLGLLHEQSYRDNAFYRNGGAEGDMALGKMVVGTALIATTSAMVLEGMATGDGPDDPGQNAIWRLNHRPNTMTIGNLTIPYQGLGPLGMLMRFSANMTETAQHWKDEGGAKLAEGFLKGFTKSVLDENFMRGIKDMLDAVYHADEYGPAYFRSFATNWLPFSVGMSQMSHQVDPYLREVNLNNDYWTQLKDTAESKTPWLSENLIPKRDRFGQPIPSSAAEAEARYKNDPTVAKMEQLGAGMSRVERKILGVPLNDQQLEQYEAASGTLAKQYLDNLIRNPGFNNLSNATQLILINKTVGSARKNARNVVLTDPAHPENLDIMRQAVQKKRQDIRGNTP